MRSGAVLLVGIAALGQTVAPGVFDRMRAEAFDRPQGAPVFDKLTIDIGPRLTASPAHKRAAEYARDWLAGHGLENARLEAFQFGRGWTNEKLTIEMVEPRYMPLIGYADGWSPSTNGVIAGSPISIAGKTPEQIDAQRATLTGAILMTAPPMSNFVRQDRAQPSDPSYVPRPAPERSGQGGRGGAAAAQRMQQALRDAAPGVILKPSRGEHGTVFVLGRDNGENAVPSLTLAAEHYNMLASMLEHNIPVKLRIEIQSRYYNEDGGRAYNVLAELPGSDPALRDEIVMIGAHLDSWHTGTGATDNADGSATVMEAMRILKDSQANPRRTIRVALWGGEEQGLLGSKAWVNEHLAGDAHTAERDRFDVYFNIDNGTGPIYGWYLENRPGVQEIFDAWLAPLKAAGARRNIIEPITNTDHVTFNNAGVPGFNPIQDYSNYDVRTHHTNMDTPDRLQVKDIQQAALAMAWFAYRAATAEQKLPRPLRQTP